MINRIVRPPDRSGSSFLPILVSFSRHVVFFFHPTISFHWFYPLETLVVQFQSCEFIPIMSACLVYSWEISIDIVWVFLLPPITYRFSDAVFLLVSFHYLSFLVQLLLWVSVFHFFTIVHTWLIKGHTFYWVQYFWSAIVLWWYLVISRFWY